MNIADKLNERIKLLQAPIVVGLDPVVTYIPNIFKMEKENTIKGISEAIFEFNTTIIDIVADIVPAVKPQIAFYEKYGYLGIQVFEMTVAYAKQKGLIVIEDGKRNDIGNTAYAYADAHLGESDLFDEKKEKIFDVDFLTVSPFLGLDTIEPFIKVAQKYNKGVFVLVKTSNSGSDLIQSVVTDGGITISELLADIVNTEAQESIGFSGYSPIGAVVGATYPEDARKLRKRMSNSLFLVPGYGAQGGGVADVLPCFNEDGLGAIVNASRSIIFAHSKKYGNDCSMEEFKMSIKDATIEMKNSIYEALKTLYSSMCY